MICVSLCTLYLCALQIWLHLEKPKDVQTKSGQYMMISADALGGGKFHPFTLTSTSDQQVQSFHILVQGEWTRKLQALYHPANLVRKEAVLDHALANQLVSHSTEFDLPPLHVKGPFGGSYGSWKTYKRLVMVAGG